MEVIHQVIVSDAIEWLSQNRDTQNISTVASMPDFSEFPNDTLESWKEWFTNTAKLVLKNTSDDGMAIFYQSDIKHNGIWVDKSFLCMQAAHELHFELLFHKIICRVPAGMTTFGRPAYSHILCFSKNHRLDTKNSTPDVMSTMGEKIWERGMGADACIMIAKLLKSELPNTILLNPFCGQGSMLSVATSFNIPSIGIERSAKRAQKASKMRFNKESKKWILAE
jgi:hypothetical protein